jgi:hypothetical protein
MDDFSIRTIELPLSEVVIRNDLYPRMRVEPTKVEEYAITLEAMPPIEVNQDNILIDGMHRLRAHEAAGRVTVPIRVTKTRSDEDIFFLAISRNAKHGLILSQDDKRSLAVKFCMLGRDQAEVCAALSISERTWREWTAKAREQQEDERRETILDLHLRCWTQEQIAKLVGGDRSVISDEIADFVGSGSFADSHIFRDFDQDDSETSGRRVYDVWNFAKAENEVRHFGNIPPQIIDNLLYLCTKPFDVVFDPFGGGGSTFDVCRRRNRRCWISDLTVKPSRKDDIRQHDITTGIGLPKGLVPDLVFLDPPYWKQAAGKYSDEATDLGNVDLETFLSTLAGIARDVKRRWTGAQSGGHLAVICGAWKEDGEKVHLPALIYERISKYLDLAEWITVPYSTQVHGGAFVKRAKEQRELLYLNRHLMVFRHG